MSNWQELLNCKYEKQKRSDAVWIAGQGKTNHRAILQIYQTRIRKKSGPLNNETVPLTDNQKEIEFTLSMLFLYSHEKNLISDLLLNAFMRIVRRTS